MDRSMVVLGVGVTLGVGQYSMLKGLSILQG